MIRRNATTNVEATTVAGDSLLVDAYVPYADTFTRSYKEKLLEDVWKHSLNKVTSELQGMFLFMEKEYLFRYEKSKT